MPTLHDAAAAPSKPQAKGITIKTPANKPAAAPSAVAAAAAAASNALSVVHETAAGYNLYCPAGLYQLSLKHPASKHLFEQILGLRALLQQMQQQAKAQHLLQQQQLSAAAAATEAPAVQQQAGQGLSGSRSPSRRVSRASSPVPLTSMEQAGMERVASGHTTGARGNFKNTPWTRHSCTHICLYSM
jgi:hypothetical protein